MTSKEFFNDKFARFYLHEVLIKDHYRTQSFFMSMTMNKHLFRDKYVLDLGSGTGILSLFAAKAGAKHVFAVECSHMAELSKEVIRKNKKDKVITVIHDKIENISKLPLGIDKVDVIVCDWLGHCLLHESMIPSLIYSRNKWLKPGGLIFPDKSSLYICAIEDNQYNENTTNWWRNVYGFDMTCMHEISLAEPTINFVDPDKVVTNACLLQELDMDTMKASDLNFSAPFYLKCLQYDKVQAFLIYFDVEFSKCHTPIAFSTSPDSPYTHWKQTIFYLKKPLSVQEGEEIHGVVSMKQNPLNKNLHITIDVEFAGQYSLLTDTLHYKMS
ncbi:hypothetical protein HELRODRAFT_155669 [Helobdella robusta]|uniref:type I protein arginine methyltransferase n=1 Tax=Helobdella robusta TaxID=6412 RepID=T1ELK2_HELRO|nr:hypothetical protein HELRODRAFT_155669 [Helobdella robusta]ESO06098.1 hypothetical protein HELRODRAFT_155669 [Helobdella robusta]